MNCQKPRPLSHSAAMFAAAAGGRCCSCSLPLLLLVLHIIVAVLAHCCYCSCSFLFIASVTRIIFPLFWCRFLLFCFLVIIVVFGTIIKLFEILTFQRNNQTVFERSHKGLTEGSCAYSKAQVVRNSKQHQTNKKQQYTTPTGISKYLSLNYRFFRIHTYLLEQRIISKHVL